MGKQRMRGLELGAVRREVVRLRLLAQVEAELARERSLISRVPIFVGLGLTTAGTVLIQRFGTSSREEQRKGAGT